MATGKRLVNVQNNALCYEIEKQSDYAMELVDPDTEEFFDIQVKPGDLKLKTVLLRLGYKIDDA